MSKIGIKVIEEDIDGELGRKRSELKWDVDRQDEN
jgi:hypothetical protein